ncbi:hypothetical protein BH09BAC1_BH09BAC1_00630 [soil metagenome]
MMQRMLILLVIGGMLVWGGCKTLKELANFARCKFRYTNITQTQLAGVDVTKVMNYKDLNFTDAAKVGANLAQGRLPLNFIINLQVNNPNAEKAALNKLDWIALIDDKELVKGVLNQRVEIASGQTATLPLTVNADLIQAFKGESKDKLPSYAFGLADNNGKPRRVGMKVKPTIMVGGASFAYSGWITLSQEFKE